MRYIVYLNLSYGIFQSVNKKFCALDTHIYIYIYISLHNSIPTDMVSFFYIEIITFILNMVQHFIYKAEIYIHYSRNQHCTFDTSK